MKSIILVIILGFNFLNANTYSQTTVKEKKVLIIGIDGCRPDALLKADTKNIDKLWKNGAYSFNAKTDEISVSGTCWTSMLTGVWHDKHKVVSNSYSNPNTGEYPHFFRRLKKIDPNIKTYSIVHWAPINSILDTNDVDESKSYDSDKEVAKEVVRCLSKKDVDVMFVQLDKVDHAGHATGFSPTNPNYLDAIRGVDKLVGKMIKALKHRKNYKNEDWLILLSTDHGGSGTSHGENIPEHTTIFFIAAGDDVIKGKIDEQVNVVDVCSTAMQHLGFSVKSDRETDGKVIGLKKK